MSSVRFLRLPLFFAVGVLRGLLGAFFEQAGALRFGMGRLRRARNLRLIAEWSSRVRARKMKLDRPFRRAAQTIEIAICDRLRSFIEGSRANSKNWRARATCGVAPRALL